MKNEDGYAVVIAIVILGVLMIILSAVASLVSSEIKFVSHAESSNKAFYVAEAGLEYASFAINDSNKWNGDNFGGTDNAIADVNSIYGSEGTLQSVAKELNGNVLELTSSAEHEGVKKTLVIEYLVDTSADFSQYSIASSSSLTLGNKIKVIASENGGDIYSTSSIFDHGAEYVGVTPLSNRSESVVPNMYDQVYDKLTEPVDEFSEDRVFVSEPNIFQNISPPPGELINYTFNDDVYYIENDKNSAFSPDKDSTFSGSGILLVNGDITFPQGFEINTATEEEILIIVDGNVTFNNAATFNGMVYASGEIRLNNSVEITGGIFSDFEIVNENKTGVEVVNSTIINHSSDYLDVFENVIGDGFIPTINGGTNKLVEIINWDETGVS